MSSVTVIKQPSNLKVKLFVHQLANICQMERMERDKKKILRDGNTIETNIGILGDPPGTGKTFTILGLICRNRMKWDDSGESEITIRNVETSNFNGSLSIVKLVKLPMIRTNLIVVPLSIITQWSLEIKKTNLSCKVVKTSRDIFSLEKYDVVLCTVTMFNNVAENYSHVCFKRFIYDEADSAFISSMLPIYAGFFWIMSATFQELVRELSLRRIHFVKDLFMKIISANYSSSEILELITIRSDEKIRGLAPNPFKEYKTIYYNIQEAPVIRHLGEFMGEGIIEMINAGDISGAINRLGGDNDCSDIAEIIRTRALEELKLAEDKVYLYRNRPELLVEWNNRLAQCRRKVDTIEQRISNISMEDCVICAESLDKPVLLGCCQSIYCGKCILDWFTQNARTCPNCRCENPTMTNLLKYNEEKEGEEEKNGEKKEKTTGTKFENMLEIIHKGKKILIFSSYDAQFKDMVNFLINNDISCCLVNGSVSTRQNSLHKYNYEDVKVMILNSRANGAGLNLQVTTDIIIWNKMPENLTTQLIGRAIRYGLKHEVTVHKFYSQEQDQNQD